MVLSIIMLYCLGSLSYFGVEILSRTTRGSPPSSPDDIPAGLIKTPFCGLLVLALFPVVGLICPIIGLVWLLFGKTFSKFLIDSVKEDLEEE